MPRPWIFGLPLVALLLGLFAGTVLGPRQQLKRQLREREEQERKHLAQVGACLQLERWSIDREGDGGLVVRAAVRAGREGRLALDAHADLGSDEVLVPDVQRAPLLPELVHGGQEVTLERHLRRVRPGDPDAISLRFSCRPPGPKGIFGVVEYATGVAREGSDGFGNVVRPLPPAR
ncbi:MAG TPA: hypothetical protein VFE93_18945 [Myxococcaceae bacterium]|jgi:hypothetical protein|nr:hypothetical protein [Myxococcaceae bacterium]